MVDRGAFDRIIAAGGYVSVSAGSAPDGNAILVPKQDADSAMDDELAAHIADSRSAVNALARLAARNDQHALDLLYARLDDQRAYIRNWVFAALTNLLPASVTSARFKAVLPTLTHADIKARVANLAR